MATNGLFIFAEALTALAIVSAGECDAILCDENGEFKIATKNVQNTVVHWIRRVPRFPPKIWLKLNDDLFSIMNFE
jgi:hypothetical protein